MSLIDDIFKGFIILSIMSLTQHGCSVKEMASQATKAHKKGLSSYGE